MGWLKSILAALGNISALFLWLFKRRAAGEPERVRREIDEAIEANDIIKETELLERGLRRPAPPPE